MILKRSADMVDVAEKDGAELTPKSEDAEALTITNVDDIPPLDPKTFRLSLLKELLNKPQNTPEGQWLMDEFSALNVAEKLSDGHIIDDEDPLFDKIYQDYLDDLSYTIKTDSFSLNEDKVNLAIRKLQGLAAMNISEDSKIDNNEFDSLMFNRFSEIPQLYETYDVVTVNREIFNMITKNSNSVSTQIEVENKVLALEDFYNDKVIDNEQMAYGYHNIAILMEGLSRQKRDAAGISTERLASYDYMSKALRLTDDPQLIKIGYEYLPSTFNKKMLFVREACDRALDRNDNDEITLFKVHTLYGKASAATINSNYLSKVDEGLYTEACYHYKEAFNNANTPERKIKTLRSLAKLQKDIEPEKYLGTRVKIAEEFLSGKSKVRELVRLAGEASETETKQALLESAANELIDCTEIKKGEKSLLMSNVINTLRPLYGKDNSKNKILDKIEAEYCQKEEKTDVVISRISSKGHDYFR